jgi:HEAT repeat protein
VDRDWRELREEALLTLVHERRPQARNMAADTLYALAVENPSRHTELSEVVPRLLGDEQVEVQQTGLALAALVLQEDEAEALLTSKLRSPQADLRLEAASQLVELGRPSSRGAFAAGLEDPEPLVRFVAACGMATLKHSAGRDVLVEALSDPELRYQALRALAALGDAGALPAVQKVFRKWILPTFERTQAAGTLAVLGDRAGEAHLRRRIKRSWSADRALAMELYGEAKGEGALALLLESLSKKDDFCRGPAARALGRLGDPAALPSLTQLLSEEDAREDFRLDAAEGLLLLGSPEALGEVDRVLERSPVSAFRTDLAALRKSYA